MSSGSIFIFHSNWFRISFPKDCNLFIGNKCRMNIKKDEEEGNEEEEEGEEDEQGYTSLNNRIRFTQNSLDVRFEAI